MNSKLLLALALVWSVGLFGSSHAEEVAQIEKRVESLPEWRMDSFRVFPLEKPRYAEDWLKYAPAPIAVSRYLFVPTGPLNGQTTATTFSATFIFTRSAEQARATMMRSGALIQVAEEFSKNYGADALES
jgi:hypothetical protein